MTGCAPPVLHGHDGGLLSAAVVLSRLAGLTGPLVLPALPAGNHALPDLLALAGISELRVDNGWRGFWTGPGGGTVRLNDCSTTRLQLTGALPAGDAAPAADKDSATALDDAPLASGAAHWRPSGPGGAGATPGLPMAIGNPLCRRRRAVAALAGRDAQTAAAIDARGGRHPLQAAGDGQLVSLELDGLEATTLGPHPGSIPGCHWEVGAQVLDNGRVRAELDVNGLLSRLCGDSQFIPWTAPALEVWTARPLELGPARVSVVERGPVRSRLAVERPGIEILLSLEAHSGVLVVEARARVPDLWLELPLGIPSMPLIAEAGPLREWPESVERVVGVRGLAWGDRQGQGLALGSRRGLTVSRSGRGLVLAVNPLLRIALAPQGRLDRGPTPWEAADSLAAHVTGPWQAAPAPVLLGLPPAVDAAWLPPLPGQRASVLLREMVGGHARITVSRPGGGSGQWRLATAAGVLKQARGMIFTATLEPHALARLDLAG
jgi:hypothetical protein